MENAFPWLSPPIGRDLAAKPLFGLADLRAASRCDFDEKVCVEMHDARFNGAHL